MTLPIPAVFDPLSRLIVENDTGANHPFEAVAANNLAAGALVYLYNNGGVLTIDQADAALSHQAVGFILQTVTSGSTVPVYTSGLNKVLSLQQGDGSGNPYTFTSSDLGVSIYLDGSLAGRITKQVPTSQNYQRIGEVIGVTDTNLQITFRPSISLSQDSLVFKGTWDASLDAPSLTVPPPGSNGWFYVVAVAGNSTINGINTWTVGDWVLSNGTEWLRISNSNQLTLASPTEYPVIDGPNADPGNGASAARYNHVHPAPTVDSLRTAVLTANGDAAPLADTLVGSLGTGVKGSRSDHSHPRNAVKTPIRYYYETPLTLHDNQPAMRVDGVSKLVGIRYYSAITVGSGTLTLYINGTSFTTLTLSSSDTGFVNKTIAATNLAVGDIISISVTGAGTASGVTVQLDIEQYV